MKKSVKKIVIRIILSVLALLLATVIVWGGLMFAPYSHYKKAKRALNVAGIQWLDCVPVSSGKGTAVEFLQQALSIGKEETMAFGDNQNDMDMLRCAGKSFAVANARDELKEIATGICGSYGEDGVLRELKKLLKGIL